MLNDLKEWFASLAAEEDEYRRETTIVDGPKVLFLGVTGVLHAHNPSIHPPRTTAWREEMLRRSEQITFSPCALNALSDLVARSRSTVVLCSQWQWAFREGPAFLAWLEAKDFPMQCLHQDPLLPRKLSSDSSHGVSFWLEKHGPCDWLLLSAWPLYRGGWQATRQILLEDGLSEEQAAKALREWGL